MQVMWRPRTSLTKGRTDKKGGGIMGAPKGNQFWKARSKHGRDKIIASAELLKEACEEYFQWVEDNPLNEERLFAYKGDVTKENVNKMRAMTIAGISIFLDISVDTWENWRNDNDKDFVGVIRWAENIIREQKFTGAAADLLNANIISRDLGLIDRQELENKGAPQIVMTKNYSAPK